MGYETVNPINDRLSVYYFGTIEGTKALHGKQNEFNIGSSLPKQSATNSVVVSVVPKLISFNFVTPRSG